MRKRVFLRNITLHFDFKKVFKTFVLLKHAVQAKTENKEKSFKKKDLLKNYK